MIYGIMTDRKYGCCVEMVQAKSLVRTWVSLDVHFLAEENSSCNIKKNQKVRHDSRSWIRL